MNIISTITGLIIAAVLYVPGTIQHEATQVEEAPVVEEYGKELRQHRWFTYDEESQAEGDIAQPSNYSHYSSDPNAEPTCAAGELLCAIYAPDNAGQPDLAPGLVETIMDVLDDPISNSDPSVKLKEDLAR